MGGWGAPGNPANSPVATPGINPYSQPQTNPYAVWGLPNPYLSDFPQGEEGKWERAMRLAGQIVEAEDGSMQDAGMSMPSLTEAPRPSIPQAMQPYMPKYELPPILEYLQRSMGES